MLNPNLRDSRRKRAAASVPFAARSCAGVIAAAVYASDTPFTASSGSSTAYAPSVVAAPGVAAQRVPYMQRSE